uniref:ABM domain-containing protein n=1 Tax=Mycena chlorophos TaxID=658473 RepID=A0ABQ0MAL2_MYCCL|nr:predicted protein [Mycena chlorophos]
MPTIQIATFPVTAEFHSAPQTFAASLDIIKTADGHIQSFYGVQTENDKQGYFISVWESFEKQAALRASPNYKVVVEALRSTTSDREKFSRHNIDVSTNAVKALSSPAAEIVIFTLNGEGDAPALTEILNELTAKLDVAPGAVPPAYFGQSREDKTKFVLVAGWESLQAHQDAVKEGTDPHSSIAKIRAVAQPVIGHSHLKVV